MSRRATWVGGVSLVLAAALIAGCAGSQSAMPLPAAKMLQPADMASLVGEWAGTIKGTAGTGPLAGRSAFARVVVAPDGTYTSNVDGTPGAGRGQIVGGKIVFEGSATRGEATLHEGGGRRVLVGKGTWVGFTGDSEFELTKR